MAFYHPAPAGDKDPPAPARRQYPSFLRDTAAPSSGHADSGPPTRLGAVRERIWNYQNKEVRNTWKTGGYLAKVLPHRVERKDYYKDDPSTTSIKINGSKEQEPKEGTSKDRATGNKFTRSRHSRMIIDKIWGHRKKEPHSKETKQELDQDSYLNHTRIHPAHLVGHRRGSHAQISQHSRESLNWERVTKESTSQQILSYLPQNSIHDFGSHAEPKNYFDDSCKRVLGRAGDRTVERSYRPSTERSHEQGHDRVPVNGADKVPVNGHSHSTTRASERFSSPNHQSQSVSDRNQSESLEDVDLNIGRRSGPRQRSEERQGLRRSSQSRQKHDDRLTSKHAIHKENVNPIRSSETVTTTHYQASVHGSSSHAGPTNTPSFRRYRRVRERKDIREGKTYQDHRGSHTSSSNKHTKAKRHHRKSKGHHSSKGTTSNRLWPNGGLPHKGDEKFSTISRYWSIERSGSSVTGGSYGRLRRSLRERGQLFQDPDFPATCRSLTTKGKTVQQPIVWLRPHEICARPKFIADGATRFDVERGECGDCWLLQAVSTLTLTPKFLDRVVPPDQAFDHTYCGIFRFRFWQFGEWVEVLVDDRLPTHKGRLLYLHSTDPAEFWAALLEKAYAKLYGSYEALQTGFTTRALQDLTGGIVQSFPLSLQDKFLCYQVLNSAVPRSSLLIASINSSKDGGSALRLRNGLVTQHAYSVTGLARVRSKMGEAPLVRLRNPWGAGEWNGPWSERSWEWDSLSDRDKDLLSVRVRNEGEFWMGFDDFIRHFSELDVVHVGPDDWMNEPALHSKKPWRAVLARRRWRAGYNAGGGPTYTETTSHNPQFHVQIPRAGLSKCHVVVSVTQQYETSLSSSISTLNSSPNNTITNSINNTHNSNQGCEKKKKKVLHPIGFAVYEIPTNLTRLTPAFVSEHAPLDVTSYSTARETVTFFTLPPGDYMVVPHTQHPNCEVRFLLRILTDEQSNIWEVNEDNMVFRSVSLSSTDDITKTSRDGRQVLQRLLSKHPPELDAATLLKLLTKHWKMFLLEKPSLELAKGLVMLRDYNISGKLAATDAPPLLLMLQFWRTAFLKFDRSSGGKTSSYALRGVLWEAGVTVSNKVLECLVLRFAKNRILTAEAFLMAMVRLHLAHERYHSIDTKMKGNPLSLEEMILMTIYS